MNPEVIRWELHRVRIVVATLKPEYQHWYQKRVFYQLLGDGKFVMQDMYDHQGNLWRTGMETRVWTPLSRYGKPKRVDIFYDFHANAYTFTRAINSVPPGSELTFNKWRPEDGLDFFGPSTARRMGLR